jgi:hypothetical protein
MPYVRKIVPLLAKLSADETTRASSAGTLPIPLPSQRSALRLFEGLGAAEVAVAGLLAAVFWLPPLVGEKAWTPALALLALLAGYTIVRRRRLPPLPVLMFVYLAAYAIALFHGRAVELSDLKQGYFVRPLTALAVAAVVTNPLQRLRALLLIVIFAVSQIPITAWQAIERVVKYGRGATAVVDNVSGSLGSSQAATVTLAALAAATIVVAAWLSGALGTWTAAATSLGLVAIGALSATRAAVGFVVVAGCAVVAGAVALGASRPPAPRLWTILLASVAAGAGIFGLTTAMYRNVFTGALNSQTVPVLGLPGPTPATGLEGVQLLPGRLAQLKLAVRLSVRDGATVAVLGRGPGSSELGTFHYPNPQSVPLPKRTGSIWLGKILTEAGWLGVSAFFVLLGWLALLGHRLAKRRAAARADRVLGLALAGVAALTAVAAAYGTLLTVRGYATVFWLLVGIAISAHYDGRPGRRLGWARATR